MNLDAKVAKLSPSNNSSSSFDYWIKLSTLRESQPIDIPLKTNYYFESQPGRLCNFIQINKDRDGGIHSCLSKFKL
jgi:hypothetical protein